MRTEAARRKVLLCGVLMALAVAPFDEGAGRDLLPLTVIGLVAVVLWIGLTRGWLLQDISNSRSPMMWPTLALLAVGAVSMAWSVDRFVTATGLVRLAACAAVLLVIVNVARGERDGRVICGALLVLACLLAPLGIFQAVAGRGLFVSSDGVARAHSVFVTPNTFAAFLILVLPMALAFAWRAETWRARLGYAAVFAGLVATLALTGSRAGWIMGAVGVMMFMLFVAKRRLRAAGVAAGIAAMLLVGAMMYAPLQARVQSLGQPLEAGAMQDRLHYWVSALAIFRETAPLGVGLDAFHMAYPAYQDRSLAGTTQWYAHNDALQMLAELGVAGLAAALWLVWSAGRTAWVALKISSDRVTVAACVAGSAAVLLQGLFEYNFYVPAVALGVFACWGVIAAAVARMRPVREAANAPEPSPARRAAAVATVALGVVCASFIVRPIIGQRMLSRSLWNAPEAVRMCPWAANFWVELGKSRLQWNELAGARAAFERAIECSPRSAVAHAYLALGWSVDKTSKESRQLGYLERAVELDPNAAGPRVGLAEAYARAGMNERARAEALVCLERCRPDPYEDHRLRHVLGNEEHEP